MSIIHDKSDSYFDNSIREKLKPDPRIPRYVRARVLYVTKSQDPSNPNFFTIKASIINNRTLNNFSERPDTFGDLEHLKQNIVLFNLSKITIIAQDKEVISEPTPGDEISALLITNEETKNLNVDGYFVRTIKPADNAKNENKQQPIEQKLKKTHKGIKNSILDSARSQEESKRYNVSISVSSPVEQTLNKIRTIAEDAQYDFYKNIIVKNGGDFFEQNTKRNLLAIRVPDPVERQTGAYNDRMVMVWKDRQGKKTVKTYVANTEPNTVKAQGLTSISKANDQFYYFGWSDHPKYKRAFLHENVKRYDLYRNRVLEKDNGGPGQTHLIHKGGISSTNSQGCQTLPRKEWDRFWADYYSDKPEEQNKKGYYAQTREGAVPGLMTYYIINYDQLDREIIEEANV